MPGFPREIEEEGDDESNDDEEDESNDDEEDEEVDDPKDLKRNNAVEEVLKKRKIG